MKYNKKPNILGDVMKMKNKIKKSPASKALEAVKAGKMKSKVC